MTVPGKNALGLKGFPTPETAVGEDAYLLFLFSDPTWAQWLLGAVKELEAEYNWYESGDLSPSEAAEAFRLINEQAPYNLYAVTPAQAPFWDNGTDVDATAPADDQPWYGELQEAVALSFFALDEDPPELAWYENIAIWAFAGFIAYAGQPLAAIAFIPFARKFVLTFKKGTAGAIVNVIFDGLHLASIDTYGVEDEVVQFLVDVGIEPSGEELWVEHSGEHNPEAIPNGDDEYTIQVVRDNLSADDISPPDTRYDEECNCVVTTYDDGETWTETPERDPRHGTYYIIPPLGEDFKCDAAGGMVALVRQMVDSVVDGAEILGVANSILAILALLSGGAGIIIDLIIAVASALIGIGAATLNGYFDETAYEVLLCAFYCGIDDDGTVSPSDIEQISAYIHENASGGVVTVMDVFLNLYGEVQLQNAGVRFADSGVDCSECECIVCDETVEVGGGGWLGLPIGIIESGIDIRSNGFIYSIDGADVVINFDHEVYVCQWIIDNDGSTATGYRLIVGTEHVDTSPSDAMTINLSPPQLVDHVTMESLTPGQGGAFGYTKVTYREP